MTTEKVKNEVLEHWRRLARCETEAEVKAEGYTASSCALCEAHPSCVDCPVMRYTGMGECKGTPYYAVFQYMNEHWPDEFDAWKFQALAEKELEFLLEVLS